MWIRHEGWYSFAAVAVLLLAGAPFSHAVNPAAASSLYEQLPVTQFASSYSGTVTPQDYQKVTNHFALSDITVNSAGDISGEMTVEPAFKTASGHVMFKSGPFTGQIKKAWKGQWTVSSPGYKFVFSFAENYVSEEYARGYSWMQGTYTINGQPSYDSWSMEDSCTSSASDELAAACIAKQLLDGVPQPGFTDIPGNPAGYIPYVSGGGHGPQVGFFYQNGSPAAGLDCSGFTRLVYDLAYGSDVLAAPGTTKTQLGDPNVKLDPVSTGSVGDLVFFFKKNGAVHHVGIDVGGGYMVDEPQSDTSAPWLRPDIISTFDKKVHGTYGFYQFIS